MKQQLFYKKILLLAFIFSIVIYSRAQQQITQTVTAQNRNCNATCSVIDIPELNNNPTAIIFITPILVNGVNANPHPIGAYYMYLNKWSIFNLDAAAITLGAKFNVEYYVNPDPTRFIFVLPQRVHFNDIVYIDNAGLNNKPNAQIRVFPHVSPTMGYLWNKLDVKVEYDAAVSKWFIANLNNTPIAPDVAYNIMYSNGNGSTNTGAGQGGSCNCVIPTSLPPNGSAGGDLGGTYPYPSVQKLQGKPLSGDPPAVGQVLKWNGTAWEPGPDNVGTATTAATNSMQTFFSNTDEWSPALSNNEDYYFANHKYTITVAVNSRLIISGNFFVQSGACLVCQSAYSVVALYINTVFKSNLSESWTAAGSKQNESVSNYMMDVTPGTYIIQFKAAHVRLENSPPTTHAARSSSIIVLPL